MKTTRLSRPAVATARCMDRNAPVVSGQVAWQSVRKDASTTTLPRYAAREVGWPRSSTSGISGIGRFWTTPSDEGGGPGTELPPPQAATPAASAMTRTRPVLQSCPRPWLTAIRMRLMSRVSAGDWERCSVVLHPLHHPQLIEAQPAGRHKAGPFPPSADRTGTPG